MHLQVSGGEENRRNTRASSLASPRLTSPGGVWRGKVRLWARAHDVRVNSPPTSGPNPHRLAASFCHLFCYEFAFNTFDRDRPSRLRDAVTLARSSLYICAAEMEIRIYQQPRNH
jgi:hypothetical protein